jgi:hypothetical protein
MGCCGQKRAALRSAPPPAVITSATPYSSHAQPVSSKVPVPGDRPVTPASAREAVSSGVPPYLSVRLRYLESSPILVRGPETGRQYQFSATEPLQTVDPRDAPALLRTGFFRQA